LENDEEQDNNDETEHLSNDERETKNLLNSARKTVFKIRKIVKKINNSNPLRLYVLKKQKLLGITENFIMDFKVRWNTSYLMIERAIKLKAVINDITTNFSEISNLSVNNIQLFIFKNFIYLVLKQTQQTKLSNLVILNDQWAVLLIIKDLLEPFYMATMHLQKQSFPGLSSSKIIEKSLIKYFSTKSMRTNKNKREKLLASHLHAFIQKHLIDKISNEQKIYSMVILNFD